MSFDDAEKKAKEARDQDTISIADSLYVCNAEEREWIWIGAGEKDSADVSE